MCNLVVTRCETHFMSNWLCWQYEDINMAVHRILNHTAKAEKILRPWPNNQSLPTNTIPPQTSRKHSTNQENKMKAVPVPDTPHPTGHTCPICKITHIPNPEGEHRHINTVCKTCSNMREANIFCCGCNAPGWTPENAKTRIGIVPGYCSECRGRFE